MNEKIKRAIAEAKPYTLDNGEIPVLFARAPSLVEIAYRVYNADLNGAECRTPEDWVAYALGSLVEGSVRGEAPGRTLDSHLFFVRLEEALVHIFGVRELVLAAESGRRGAFERKLSELAPLGRFLEAAGIGVPGLFAIAQIGRRGRRERPTFTIQEVQRLQMCAGRIAVAASLEAAKTKETKETA